MGLEPSKPFKGFAYSFIINLNAYDLEKVDYQVCL